MLKYWKCQKDPKKMPKLQKIFPKYFLNKLN